VLAVVGRLLIRSRSRRGVVGTWIGPMRVKIRLEPQDKESSEMAELVSDDARERPAPDSITNTKLASIKITST